jgi:Putative peptidoglycan binding domain
VDTTIHPPIVQLGDTTRRPNGREWNYQPGRTELRKEEGIDMSTTYSTAEPQQPRSLLVATGSICVIAIMAVAAFLGFALGIHTESTSAATAPAHTHTVVVPVTPKPSTTPGAVRTLQQQLAQLHLYAGSIDGIMGPETSAGIAAIQREAGLPQTGTMNSATQAALNYYLANDLPGSG